MKIFVFGDGKCMVLVHGDRVSLLTMVSMTISELEDSVGDGCEW